MYQVVKFDLLFINSFNDILFGCCIILLNSISSACQICEIMSYGMTVKSNANLNKYDF